MLIVRPGLIRLRARALRNARRLERTCDRTYAVTKGGKLCLPNLVSNSVTFGMVRAVQKGELSPPSKEIADAAKTMKPSDVRDFASTKHKGLPMTISSEEKQAGMQKTARFVTNYVLLKQAGALVSPLGKLLGRSMGKSLAPTSSPAASKPVAPKPTAPTPAAPKPVAPKPTAPTPVASRLRSGGGNMVPSR